jgi:hypothetical protein
VKFPKFYLVCDCLLKSAGILTAVAVAVATVGIPLPVPFVKDSTALFPCLDCGCGCASADMCWRQCCCYTNAEKLVWAHKHGVKAPDFVLAQVAIETCENAEELADVKPCCRQRVLAARVRDCCGRKTGVCESEVDTRQPVAPGILAIQALKCQGNSLSLSLLPPSIPTDDIGTELELSPSDSIALAESDSYQPPFFETVVPPPERAVS